LPLESKEPKAAPAFPFVPGRPEPPDAVTGGAAPPGEDDVQLQAPELPPDPSFEPSYALQSIEVRGNRKTATALIVREVGLHVGDVVTANDARVALARLRLLALGYFLDAHLSLVKGSERGQANLIVEVEERGTIILDAIYLGTSDATAVWGGLAATERNLLGRGLSLGGGFVGSTRPNVAGAEPGFAGSMAEPDEHDRVVFGAGDDNRQILILFVVSMKHNQLLLPVRGVVEGIDIEGEMPGRLVEGLDERINEHIA